MYGDVEVPLLQRPWRKNHERLPYRKTYSLKPGQHWREAPSTTEQWEHYVHLPEGPVPVGAAIARELISEGASCAVFTECWGRGCVMMGPDLVCLEWNSEIATLLKKLRSANGDRWAGLPDVIALFPCGRIAMREAKVAGKDKISETQHAFARSARALLGSRFDLAVVEWGRETANVI